MNHHEDPLGKCWVRNEHVFPRSQGIVESSECFELDIDAVTATEGIGCPFEDVHEWVPSGGSVNCFGDVWAAFEVEEELLLEWRCLDGSLEGGVDSLPEE